MIVYVNHADMHAMQTLTEQGFYLYREEVRRQEKSTGVAYLLLLFLGSLGVHKFYLNKAIGFVYVVASVTAYNAYTHMRSVELANPYGPFLYNNVLMFAGVIGGLYVIGSLLVDLLSMGNQVEAHNRVTRQRILAMVAYSFARYPQAPQPPSAAVPVAANQTPYNFPPPPNRR